MTTQRWPTAWLMTDERMGDRLWPAIECAGDLAAGIIFRHHSTEREKRAVLGSQVADLAHRRGLVLGVARDAVLAQELGAALVHNPEEQTRELPVSRAVHNEAEAAVARDEGAALVFVSPVYATNSHPRGLVLGEKEAARLAMIADVPAFALGGVSGREWPRLKQLGFAGWAGIDAWLEMVDGRVGQ
jgi:thiamine-phosphate pyrophosphorylase